MAPDRAVKKNLPRELAFQLSAFDGKTINCWLSRAADKPAAKAVILSHGLTGHPNEYIHMAARNYFNDRGYDVYRFAYYWSEAGNRILRDCTLEIHGKDLNTVLAHVGKNHEKIFVCGHSYGGAAMLFANPQADAISFWDSTFDPWNEFWKNEHGYIPELDCYTIGWGSLHLVGKAMVEEAKNLSTEQATAKARALTAPANVIIAEHGGHGTGGLKLYNALRNTRDMHEVKGASHCFTEGDIVYELLDKTYEWFERF